jgi:hypothetical protein
MSTHSISSDASLVEGGVARDRALATSRDAESRPLLGHTVEDHGPVPLRDHDMEVVREKVLEHSAPHSRPPILTSGASSCPDVAADYSMFLRTFLNIWMDSPGLSAMGMTTAFNDFQGAIASGKAFRRLQAARKIGDERGAREAQVDIARGVFQAAGGTLFTALRPMSIVCDVNKISVAANSTSGLGRATFGVSTAGNALFGIFYGVIAGWCGYTLYEAGEFKDKMNLGKDPTRLDDPENLKGYVDFLTEKRAHATAKTTLEKLFKKYGNYPKPEVEVRKHLRKEALSVTKEWVQATFNEIKEAKGSALKITSKECEEIAESLFEFIDESGLVPKEELLASWGLDPVKDASLYEMASKMSFLELTGLDVAVAKRQLKKEAKIARVTSGECIKLIKEAQQSRLSERLESEDPQVQAEAVKEAQHLMEKVFSSMSVNKRLNWALLLAGVIGLIATVLGCVFTAGIGPAVIAVVFLLVTLLMTYVDMSYLHMGLTSDGPIGKWDKWLVGLNTALCVISIITVIVLASVFSMGIAPLVISLVIGVLWLGVCTYTFVKLDQKQKKYEENHPTMDSLQNRVSKLDGKAPIDQKTRKLFEKLHGSHRSAIKAGLAKEVPHADRRELREEDRRYDTNYNFGYEFFQAHPLQDDVVSAVEKVYAETHSMEVRALFDRMRRIQRGTVPATPEALDQLRSFFNTRLDPSLRDRICGEIYTIRSEDGISRYYRTQEITNARLLEEISERKVFLQQERDKETERMRSIFLSHRRNKKTV